MEGVCTSAAFVFLATLEALQPRCAVTAGPNHAIQTLRTLRMLMNWLSFTANNDVVAVALIVTLAVLAILFASLSLADRLRRKSRQKRGNDL
jgi:hypothetical protein